MRNLFPYRFTVQLFIIAFLIIVGTIIYFEKFRHVDSDQAIQLTPPINLPKLRTPDGFAEKKVLTNDEKSSQNLSLSQNNSPKTSSNKAKIPDGTQQLASRKVSTQNQDQPIKQIKESIGSPPQKVKSDEFPKGLPESTNQEIQLVDSDNRDEDSDRSGEVLSGIEILDRVYQLKVPQDMTAGVMISLVTRERDKSSVLFKRHWKNFMGKNDINTKALYMIENLPDSKGTGYLIWTYLMAPKNPDFWIYIPSLRQTRQVNDIQHTVPLSGSDLTFYDLEHWRLDEEDPQFIREELYRGKYCFVVEVVSKMDDDLYSRKIHWITVKSFLPLKTEFYGRDGTLLKTQTINWQKIDGFYVWKTSEIINMQNQHKTIVELSQIKMNTGLSDILFTEKAMKTGLQ